MTLATVTIPMKLPSLANARMHWAARARLVKQQRDAVTLALKTSKDTWSMSAAAAAFYPGPLVITITRCAPRQLDDDNAVSAAKPTRDAIAAFLGLDDRDTRLRFVVRQEKAEEASVRIEFEVAQPATEVRE